MATSTVLTNKPINPRGDDNRPVDSYNRASLYSGKALDFDGANDLVNTTYSSGFTGAQEFTYCVYVNAHTNQQTQTIVHGNENVGWGLQSLQVRTETNGIRFFAGTGSSSTSYVDSDPIEANKWYFVVGTHTPTENKIYLNGALNATATAANLTAAPQAITIGAYPWATVAFNGEISSPRIFNTALTAAQVADLYNNPEKVVPTGVNNTALKLWLPMMEGAGTTAYDGSGNGNHGTISGATYVNGVGAPVAQSAVMDWNKGSNLITQTEAIASNWSSAGGTWTSGQDDPFGGTNAYKITSTSSDVYTLRNASNGISGTQYTAKCWVKGDTGREARLWIIRDNIEFPYEDFTLNGDWQEIETTKTFGTTPVSFVSFRLDAPNDTPGAGDVSYIFAPRLVAGDNADVYTPTLSTAQTSPVLLPQGLTSGRDITGVNLFENVRKQGALNLDGNSWAEVHDNASTDMTQAISVEAWVYWDSGSTGYGILGKWSSYLMYISTNTAEFYINGAKESNNYTISTAGWYHLVGTYDKANQKLYVNGTLINSSAKTADITTQAKPLEIGRFNQSTGSQYKDQIAQPRIYNRALTASEVLNNFNATKDLYI